MQYKIFTTVGTSIAGKLSGLGGFGNTSFSQKWEDKKATFESKKGTFENNVKKEKDNTQLSAEIASIIKIVASKSADDTFVVYLIATDTLESAVCAWCIKEWFATNEEKYKNITVKFELNANDSHVIKSLRTDNGEELMNEGFDNLVNFIKKHTLENITSTIFDSKTQQDVVFTEKIRNPNVIINFTGGYKAIIPILNIVAILYDWELAYTYEENDSPLIQMGNFPLNFDIMLAEQYFPYLIEIDAKSGAAKQTFIVENQDVLNDLFAMHLLKKESYNQTPLAKIFIEYIEENRIISQKSTISYMVEYKVFEYYLTNKYKGFDSVKHSLELKDVNNRTVSEVDIFMKDTTLNTFVDVEIKSANLLLTSTSIIAQFNSRFDFYTNDAIGRNLGVFDEYQLVVYRIISTNSRFGGNAELTRRMKDVQTAVESRGIKFKGFIITLAENHTPHTNWKDKKIEQQNVYLAFMQNKLRMPVAVLKTNQQ